MTTLTEHALIELSRKAEHIARQAGQLILTLRQQNKLEHNYKSGHELVTNADLQSDRLIRDYLQQHFPEHAVLSEELASDYTGTSLNQPNLWIIDPIDGTVNFAHNQQHVAVSIAYAESGIVKAGVVYNPVLDECFTAIADQSARLNGIPIQVSSSNTLKHSLVATGFPYDKTLIPSLLPRLHKVLSHCQDIRRCGSAAMDICYVACGRLDAYYETVKPWDFAAARLIALQAGAMAGHLDGCPEDIPAALYGEQMLVSTPEIYPALHQLLQPGAL